MKDTCIYTYMYMCTNVHSYICVEIFHIYEKDRAHERECVCVCVCVCIQALHNNVFSQQWTTFIMVAP